MISKSVKNKRRQQAAEAAQILDALWAAVPADAGTSEGAWPSCQALNEREGVMKLGDLAQRLARYPRGSSARADAAFYAADASVCSALGHCTPEAVLLKAGLL